MISLSELNRNFPSSPMNKHLSVGDCWLLISLVLLNLLVFAALVCFVCWGWVGAYAVWASIFCFILLSVTHDEIALITNLVRTRYEFEESKHQEQLLREEVMRMEQEEDGGREPYRWVGL